MSDSKIFMIVSSIFIVIAIALAIVAIVSAPGAAEQGAKGFQGPSGARGTAGPTGDKGPSGGECDLEKCKSDVAGPTGPEGPAGTSAYSSWLKVEGEGAGSTATFLASLKGTDGVTPDVSHFATKADVNAAVAAAATAQTTADAAKATADAAAPMASLKNSSLDVKFKTMEANATFVLQTSFGRANGTPTAYIQAGSDQMYPTRTGGSPGAWTRPRLWTT